MIDLITLQIAHTPQQFIYKQNGENIEILPISNAETTNELFQTDSSGEPKILIDSVVFFLPHAKNRLLPSYYDDLCNLDFDGLLHLWLIWLKDAVEQSKAFLSNPTEQPLRTILSQSHLAFMHNVLHDIKKYAHENKGFLC
ncbi:MAG: hypothetical protein HWD59_04985 [Coxiellaceae bacterium]|nr:MAG: hypothetical protein HWD59_04985 [Coxiellaceae bacterium]